MTKLKCKKCGLRFKDRQDPKDEGLVHKELCWNCRFVWQMIGYWLQALPSKINRQVIIELDKIIIRVKPKR